MVALAAAALAARQGEASRERAMASMRLRSNADARAPLGGVCWLLMLFLSGGGGQVVVVSVGPACSRNEV